jgi:hypothetical protein
MYLAKYNARDVTLLKFTLIFLTNEIIDYVSTFIQNVCFHYSYLH